MVNQLCGLVHRHLSSISLTISFTVDKSRISLSSPWVTSNFSFKEDSTGPARSDQCLEIVRIHEVCSISTHYSIQRRTALTPTQNKQRSISSRNHEVSHSTPEKNFLPSKVFRISGYEDFLLFMSGSK